MDYKEYLDARVDRKSFNRFDDGYVSLQDANLQGAYLQDADLQGAYLQGADLRGAYLQDANLQGAYLQDADLRGADLQGANLRDAYLQGANLRDAYLQDTYLQDANLQGADLQGADLQGADLQGAKGIIVMTGIGNTFRLVFAYVFDNEIRIQAGCFNGTIEELKKAVNKKYTVESIGYKQYMLFCDMAEISLTSLIVKD